MTDSIQEGKSKRSHFDIPPALKEPGFPLQGLDVPSRETGY